MDISSNDSRLQGKEREKPLFVEFFSKWNPRQMFIINENVMLNRHNDRHLLIC